MTTYLEETLTEVDMNPLGHELESVQYELRKLVDLDALAGALSRNTYAQVPDEIRMSDFISRPDFYHSETSAGVKQTPLEHTKLTDRVTVYDKREDLQAPGAYKFRGASLDISLAIEENPSLRVFTTASAGNHALGVAHKVMQLNKKRDSSGFSGGRYEAHIYCLQTISDAKREELLKFKEWGVTLHGDYDVFDAALTEAELAAELNSTETHFVPPFDHQRIIAGQATLGLELLGDLQLDGVDLLKDEIVAFVPIGGGGLLSGTVTAWEWAKREGILGDSARLVGVQMEGCDAMTREIMNEPALTLDRLNKMCDGTAVLTAGKQTTSIVKDSVSDFVRVTELEVANAMMHSGLDHGGHIPEPAGALSAAGAKRLINELTQSERNNSNRLAIITLTTGSNVSSSTVNYFRRLAGDAKWNQFKSSFNPSLNVEDTDANLESYFSSLAHGIGKTVVAAGISGRFRP